MSVLLVDSNVLLDVFTEDVVWFDWSRRTLERMADQSRLVINPVIYAEVSIGFDTIEEFDDALPSASAAREAIPFEAGFLAGKAIAAYRARGGTKTRALPDFLIGAHAAISGYGLLTRDPKVYRTYFPSVELVAPPDVG